MNAARMISAPMMPNISTRCWYRAGIANAAKITANTNTLSSDRLFSIRYPAR